jgi:hypothetical protein
MTVLVIEPPEGNVSTGFARTPLQPQGQGFIAAINWVLQGKSVVTPFRRMEREPDSRGLRRASTKALGNCGSSSMKRTPVWESGNSPGIGAFLPPAIRLASVIAGEMLLKGRRSLPEASIGKPVPEAP